MKRLTCTLLCVLLMVGALTVPAAAAPEIQQGELSIDTSATDNVQKTYSEYRAENTDAAYPGESASAEINLAIGDSSESPILEPDHAGAAVALKAAEKSFVTVPVTVNTAGWYQIALTYEAIGGKGTDIQFSLAIDGSLPFKEAEGILINRLWHEEYPEGVDKDDDMIRPSQVQVTGTQTGRLSAGDAYTDDYSYFYFSEGKHTLTVGAQRGEFWIGDITLCQAERLVSYKEYLAAYAGNNLSPSKFKADPIYLQGEEAALKSHSSVKSIADYSSCDTMPYDVTRDFLNTFGGENWAVSGQWGEWDFDVKTAGFYQLFFRYKQNYKAGTYVVRSILLDGKAPFEEAAYINFSYDLGWCVSALGGDEPMYIYLEPGKHTLRLEVAYGALSPVLTEVQSCLDIMNVLYRDVMMITGATPDALRDYNISEALPECGATCKDLSDRLYALMERLEKDTGGKGTETAALEKAALQLKEIAEDVETMPQRLSAFNANVSSLASWLITAKNQPLLLDYMQLAPVGAEKPRADAPWYMLLWNEVQRFFMSFIENYDNISTAETVDKDAVTIWLSVGRDQALVMQSLIRDSFTAETGIPVRLRLISMDSLMPAVASGVGPDVAMFQDQNTVINYALRNAVYDLNNFPDIEEVKKRFYSESLRCYSLDGALYGLPESISCDVMYYRKDIFKELGISVPETWEDLYKVITVLERNNLQFGINSSFTTATTNAVSSTFLALLYQMGGEVYDADNRYCVLNEEVGVKAFTTFCEFYTKYGVEQKIDMLTRFRTGEAPLLINAFAFSSQLAVSAPEISGLWETTLIPGTRKEDGSIDRSTLISNGGAIMFNNNRNKENAWEYIKWWTRADTQAQYAEAIESTLGESGRWNSANIEALSNSAWSTKELAVIQSQLSQAKALPEVAGGYYTGRSINNAIRTVVTSYQEPKETLYEYVTDINKEIRQKRREFGMDY